MEVFDLDADGFPIAPKNYRDPYGERQKVALMWFQTQHFANKFKENPSLRIVLHFIDDEKEHILKPLEGFYKNSPCLIPPRVSLRLWHRNPNLENDSAIQGFNPIQGTGFRISDYFETVLFLPNFDQAYRAVTKQSLNRFKLSKFIDRINQYTLDMHPYGLPITRANAFRHVSEIHTPCETSFLDDPTEFQLEAFLQWCVRRYCYSIHEYTLEHNTDHWQVKRFPAIHEDIAKQAFENLRQSLDFAFNLKGAGDKCLSLIRDPNPMVRGIFKSWIITIKLDELVNLLNRNQDAREDKSATQDLAM